MDSAFIQQMLLPIVFVVVGIGAIWALIELIVFLRGTRKTLKTLEEEVRPVISDVREMTESLKPAASKIDPLAERISLAVDAVNLEIMRLDGILENVDSLTSSASSAANAVDTVANTPLKLVSTAADRLRGVFLHKKASDASIALGSAAEEEETAEGGSAKRDTSYDSVVPASGPADVFSVSSAQAAASTEPPFSDPAASVPADSAKSSSSEPVAPEAVFFGSASPNSASSDSVKPFSLDPEVHVSTADPITASPKFSERTDTSPKPQATQTDKQPQGLEKGYYTYGS